ncbi:hypothetical protein LAY57_24935 [Argonema antarcticum A004/B2]|nr:hypothetical protein [Argonema antarcticum A004/B2]
MAGSKNKYFYLFLANLVLQNINVLSSFWLLLVVSGQWSVVSGQCFGSR